MHVHVDTGANGQTSSKRHDGADEADVKNPTKVLHACGQSGSHETLGVFDSELARNHGNNVEPRRHYEIRRIEIEDLADVVVAIPTHQSRLLRIILRKQRGDNQTSCKHTAKRKIHQLQIMYGQWFRLIRIQDPLAKEPIEHSTLDDDHHREANSDTQTHFLTIRTCHAAVPTLKSGVQLKNE